MRKAVAALEKRVENVKQRIGGEVYRNNFGVLQDTLHRCLRNSALWPQWESLTAEIIEKGF